ncbi:uncharacterized protein LOC120339340 isoform X2 [Styela clava]
MAQDDKPLNEFLAYVNDLYQIVPPGRITGFDVDFQKLKQLSADLKQSPDHESHAGQIPENKKKNRYKDITPFDFSRVKLTNTNDDVNSDYINASFIKGADGHQNYIASQGPLPHTILDFWQMLWQYNIKVIVMVCREIELGKKKCERYWADRGESKTFGDIVVSLSQKDDLKDGYCLRTIKAEKGNEVRYIHQFHYVSWPDHGVPKTCLEILTLINHVRDVQSYSQDESTPLCVHCSAGCGRTGAVLAVDYVRNLLEYKRVPSGLKAFNIISDMRKQRPAIVQTKDQYEFVNMAIAEMFRVYMQIRTVSFKEFNNGYQQGDYVNVNISSATSNGIDKKNVAESQRPTALSYENIDFLRKQQNKMRTLDRGQKFSHSPTEDDTPPAKPSRPALGRPMSQITVNNSQSTYTNLNDRKQSVPVVSSNLANDRKPPSPTVTPVTPKPRVMQKNQNLLNNSNVRSPAHPRTTSGSQIPGKEIVKAPPLSTKPKPVKPEPSARKPNASPPIKPPGKPTLPSQVHVKTSNDSSSTKSNISFSLILPQNSDQKSPKSPHPQPPKKPPLLKAPKSPKSPISDKVHLFETKDIKTPNVALKPVPKKPAMKIQETILHITEEGDVDNDTDKKSPISDKAKSSHPLTKKTPPAVMPKPKATKVIIQEFENSQDLPKKPIFKQTNHAMRSSLKGRTGLRPYSQIFEQSAKVNEQSKSGISKSVFDLNETKKTRSTVPQKSTIVRSASVSEMDSKVPKSYENIGPNRSKNNPNRHNEDVGIKMFPIQGKSYTQADASYGAVFVATTKPETKDSSEFPPTRRESVNLRVATPKPYIKQSLSPHRGDFAKNVDSSAKKASENKVTALPPAYENTIILQQTNKQISTNHIVSNDADHKYVNTQFGDTETDNDRQSPEQLSTVIKVLPQAPDKNLKPGSTSSITPPNAPTQSNKPTNVATYENTELHGCVHSTDNEGSNSKPEETKKRAPPKPQRSMRRQNNPHIKNVVKDDPPSKNTATKFQKYNKTNLYNEVVLGDSPSEENSQFIDDAYGEINDDVSVQRSNSNTSADISPSPQHRRSATPPRLPVRTAESQIVLTEAAPALPTRTADSYVTIEDSEEQQTYEAVEQSSLSSPSPKAPQADSGRRPSANVALGTNIIAAKAKGLMEKTSNAFSKVGATIGKSKEEDSHGSPPTTMTDRTPTYVATPVIHGGQDISFGKRLKRKIKGARNQK